MEDYFDLKIVISWISPGYTKYRSSSLAPAKNWNIEMCLLNIFSAIWNIKQIIMLKPAWNGKSLLLMEWHSRSSSEHQKRQLSF
jgi:hypothetical protein